MVSTFHLQGWWRLCFWNNSLCWPTGHNSAEKRESSRFWSSLAAAHFFWLMHCHVFLHWLVTQKLIKSPARWAVPLLRLGCKRGCLCQISALFWTCVNCCVTVSLWICLETALQLPLLLLFYLERSSWACSWAILSVLPLWHFAWERDESQTGYMPCPRECELEGKAPGLLVIVSLKPPNHTFHRAGGWCGLLVLWVLLKGGWALLFCSASWEKNLLGLPDLSNCKEFKWIRKGTSKNIPSILMPHGFVARLCVTDRGMCNEGQKWDKGNIVSLDAFWTIEISTP